MSSKRGNPLMGFVGYMGKKSKKSDTQRGGDACGDYRVYAITELHCRCRDINLKLSKEGYYCKNCTVPVSQSLITDLYETADDLVGSMLSVEHGSIDQMGSRKKYRVVPRCDDSNPIEDLRSKLDAAEGEKYSLNEEIAALRKKAEEKESDASKLRAEIDDLNRINQELFEQTNILRNQMQVLQNSNAELQRKASEQHRIINELRRQLAVMERELDETLRRRSAELRAKDSMQVRAVVVDFLDFIGHINNMVEDGHSFNRGLYDILSERLRSLTKVHGAELLWHSRGTQLGDEQLHEPSIVFTGQQSQDMRVCRMESIGCRFKDGAFEDIPERLSIYRYNPEMDVSTGRTDVMGTAGAEGQDGGLSVDDDSQEYRDQNDSEEAEPVHQKNPSLSDAIVFPAPCQATGGVAPQVVQQSADDRPAETEVEAGEESIDNASVPEPASDGGAVHPSSAEDEDEVLAERAVEGEVAESASSEDQDVGLPSEEVDDVVPQNESPITDISYVELEETTSDRLRSQEPTVDIHVPEQSLISGALLSEIQRFEVPSEEEAGVAPSSVQNVTASKSVEHRGEVADGQSDGSHVQETTGGSDVPESSSMPESFMQEGHEGEAPSEKEGRIPRELMLCNTCDAVRHSSSSGSEVASTGTVGSVGHNTKEKAEKL